MMAKILDGKATANDLLENVANKISKLKANGIVPGLAVILVGDNPASQVYVRNKRKKAEKLGINFVLKELPKDSTQEEVLQLVEQFNHDEKINGILVQSPLPKQIDEEKVIRMIDPKKDVDGLHPQNLGLLFGNIKQYYPVACTPKGVITLLNKYQINVDGKNVVIVGRSKLVGKPLLALLNNLNATVTLAHSHTHNLEEITKKADILIATVGKIGVITDNMVKPGAVVIDVGINRNSDGKLVGDVADNVKEVASYITPVPGGVGPMTVATLMEQVVELTAVQTNNENLLE
ncbi:MAG: bifunctional methylenetetrahydrofolate dehydrogenase/methenyltetrahydrofolate cyclohydrolase FolD [Firmicutes bacterium]|uniref:Bifunctional protein FolD n=1 Tax=Candidatus Gallilactobacillus intestinavium TaxID=2840838 RepID=A0A9D9E6Q0_9LACO|nr:bifunctional methylenetetrahydrofolate dehydrogenase/methenyltetrahydrofolate cyclohydrolase FolD [Candidatus Gallilactobacillus intestinavium]